VIAALVFEALSLDRLKDPATSLDLVAPEGDLVRLADARISVLADLLKKHYEGSIVPTLFKNLTKCEHLADEFRLSL
jgi:hypothetical protein